MDIKLRPWTTMDLDCLVRHANSLHIAKWLTNAFPHPYKYEDGKKFLFMASKEQPTKVFAIEVDGQPVGSIGIFQQSDIHEKNAELGYWLSKEYWRKGITTQALHEIVEYGFNTFDINRIFARVFSTNTASQRVLEKVGFTLEARFVKTLFKRGEYLDELIYAKRKQ